jgi:VanZ family protein
MVTLPEAVRPGYLIALWRIAFCIATLLVTVMSLLPGTALPQISGIGDKAEHALAYAILGTLAGLGWSPGRTRGAIVAGLIVLGGAIEIGQNAVPGRYGEWADFAADILGVLAAYALVRLRDALPRPR